MSNRPRLEFLDGMRGICAIYVALFHSILFTGHGVTSDSIADAIKPVKFFAEFGHYSVAIFIVLSGYCLTIPVALAKNKELRGGFRSYILRRARRIIPPYYFALGISGV